jgi:peptide/nickel transport system substrate-binding protein
MTTSSIRIGIFAGLLCALAAIAPARADKRSNTLVVAFNAEVDTLDPATGFAGTDYSVLYSIYDRLINFDPKTMLPLPGLAAKWEFSGPDKRDFTMTLQPGVKFQDGTPVDAAAVKASLMHFKDMKRLNDLDVVTSIDTVGTDTVVLHLAQQYSVLPAVLADRAGMVVSPTALAKYGKDFPRNPVGAGPFMLRNWAAGTSIDLARFPDYWAPQRIHLAGIEYKLILNPTSVISAMLSGQADQTWGVDPKNLPVLRASSRLRVAVEPSTQYTYLALRHDIPPMDNKLVREAMSMSVDRQVLADAVLGPGNSGGPALMLTPPASFAYSHDLAESVPYDPAKAKQLLAQAGFPNGITVKVCGSPAVGQGSDMTDVESEQMRPAGIKLNVTIMSGSACLQRLNASKDFDAWQGAFSGRPDPYLTYSQTFTSTGQFNRGRQPYPAADALIAKIPTLYSQEAQKPVYDQINRLWIEEAPAIQLFYVPNFAVYATDLAGEQPSQQGKPDLVSMYFK